MQNPFKKDGSKEFDDLIEALIKEMQTYGPGTPEYKEAMEHMSKLTAMRELRSKPRVSPDMMILCATHFFGIALMGLIEAKGHTFSGNAKNLLPRLRN